MWSAFKSLQKLAKLGKFENSFYLATKKNRNGTYKTYLLVEYFLLDELIAICVVSML